MMKVFLALAAIACVAAVEFQQTEFAFGSEANVAPQQKSSVASAEKKPVRYVREFRTIKTELQMATKETRSPGYGYYEHSSTSCSPLVGHYTFKMVNHHGIFGVPLRFGPFTVNAIPPDMIPIIDPTNAWDPFNGVYNLLAAASSIGILTIAPDCSLTAEAEVLYFAQPGYLPSLDLKEQFRAGTVAAGCRVTRQGLYFEVICDAQPDIFVFGWLTMACSIDTEDSFSCITAVFFGTPDIAGVHHITAQRTYGSLRDAPNADKLNPIEHVNTNILEQFKDVPRIPDVVLQGPKNESHSSSLDRVQVSIKAGGRASRDNHCSGIAGTFSFTAITNIGAAGNFDYQLNQESGVSIGFATIAPNCDFDIGGYSLRYAQVNNDFYPLESGANMESCSVYRSSNKWFTIDCRCSQNPVLADQLRTNQVVGTDGMEGAYYSNPFSTNIGLEFVSREVDICTDDRLLTMRCLMNSRFDIDCVASAFLGEWSTKTSHDITMSRMKDSAVQGESIAPQFQA